MVPFALLGVAVCLFAGYVWLVLKIQESRA
jgi:hypothetical protein